jgi:hypothetical protein
LWFANYTIAVANHKPKLWKNKKEIKRPLIEVTFDFALSATLE